MRHCYSIHAYFSHCDSIECFVVAYCFLHCSSVSESCWYLCHTWSAYLRLCVCVCKRAIQNCIVEWMCSGSVFCGGNFIAEKLYHLETGHFYAYWGVLATYRAGIASNRGNHIDSLVLFRAMHPSLLDASWKMLFRLYWRMIFGVSHWMSRECKRSDIASKW